MYSNNAKIKIIALARKSIENFLATGKRLEIDPSQLLPELLENKPALSHSGWMIICAAVWGMWTSSQPLYQDVIENAEAAAFMMSVLILY